MVSKGRDWTHLILADDWIRLAVLAPFSGRSPSATPTHSVGDTLISLRAALPPFHDILATLAPHRSASAIGQALQSTYGQTMEPLRPLIEAGRGASHWNTFWRYCANFIRSIDIGLSNLSGGPPSSRPQIRLSDAGFKVHAGRRMGADLPVPELWGESAQISNTDALVLGHTNSASNAALFTSLHPHGHHIHLGPLAMCSSACDDCANLFPSTSPFSAPGTGWPEGFNKGSTMRRPTPKLDILHFARSLNGLRFKSNPPCGFCLHTSTPPPPITPPTLGELTPLRADSDSDFIAEPDPPTQADAPRPPPHPEWGDPSPPPRNHKLFGAGTYNMRLTTNLLHRNLTAALRAAYVSDLTILGITETATPPSAIPVSPEGIAERALLQGAFTKRYLTLWSFLPDGRHAGAGVTLIWDARVPHSSPFTDDAGRIAAITLHGPHTQAVRIICVYAYANPSSRKDAAGAASLRSTLLSQIELAQNARQKLVIMGDWQTSLGDDAFDRGAPYLEGAALLPSLAQAGLTDCFRHRHPTLNGWSYEPLGRRAHTDRAGRLDSIWMNKRLLGSAHSPTELHSHVDQAQSIIPFSDHRLVTTHVPFRKLFDADANTVRSEHRDSMIDYLEIRHLKGDELTNFHSKLLEDPALRDLDLALNIHFPRCNCSLQPAAPWPLPTQEQPDAVEVNPGARTRECKCSALHPPPPDAQQILDTLESTWSTALIKAVAPPATQRPPPAIYGPPIKPTALDSFRSSLSRLSTKLHKVDSPRSQAEVLRRWNTLSHDGAALPLVPNDLLTPWDGHSAPEETATLLSSRCAALTSHLRCSDAKWRSSYFKGKITARKALHLASFESGKMKSFLKKVAHEYVPKLHHVQVPTTSGGYSTDPDLVKRKFADLMSDWFRVRRPHRPASHDFDKIYAEPPAPHIDVTYAVSMPELLRSLRKVPLDSAPGPSGISAALLRKLPYPTLTTLLRILNLSLQWGLIPTAYQHANIYPAPKKGKLALDNCRPISLLEVPLKLLTRIVNERLLHAVTDNKYLSPNQWGFRPGMSATDPFHVLLGAIEDAKQFNKKLHYALIDLTKAFDSIEPWSLQQAYRQAGLSSATRAFLGSMDGKGTAQVITPFGLSPTFKVGRGVRQGETLSPLKFLLWLEPWLHHIRKLQPRGGYAMKEGTRVHTLAYADDMALVGRSHGEIQSIMSSFTSFLDYHGVTISVDDNPDISKTKYTHNDPLCKKTLNVKQFCRSTTSNPHRSTFRLAALPPSAVLRYLGGQISLDLKWKAAIKEIKKSLSSVLARLAHRRIDLSEALAAATTVVQGKAAYYLQLAPFTLGDLRALDSTMDTMMRRKGGFPSGTPMHYLHSPKTKGGQSLFRFQDLMTTSQGTELMVRLTSQGLVGAVARERWEAALTYLDTSLPSPHCKPPKFSLTLHTLWMLARHGYSILSDDLLQEIRPTLEDSRLIHDYIPHKFIPYLERLQIRFYDQLIHDNNFRPWPAICRTLRAEPRWFRELKAEMGDLPHAIVPPPTKPTQAPDPWHPSPVFTPPPTTKPEETLPPHPLLSNSENSLTFFTDGSLDPRTFKGAFAIIGPGKVSEEPLPPTPPHPTPTMPPPDDTYSYESDSSEPLGSTHTPQPNGWRQSSLGTWSTLSRSYECYGAEPISIDTMELMAIVELAENPPQQDILVYTDSAYVLKGCSKAPLTPRRILRQSNRALWHSLRTAIKKHTDKNLRFVVAKCAAHGRDPKQHASISINNDRADAAAKTANKRNHEIHRILKEPSGLQLLYRGRTVRGDPRRHMKKYFQYEQYQRACEIKKGGIIPDLSAHPSPFSASSIRTPLSPHKAYRAGYLNLLPFTYASRVNSLYTPSKSFRNTRDRGRPTRIDDLALRLAASRPAAPQSRNATKKRVRRFPPKEAFTPTDEACLPLCPLCLNPNPDTPHYITHRCADVEKLSGPLRRTTATLLRSLAAGKPSGTPLPTGLSHWLGSLTTPVTSHWAVANQSHFPGTSSFIDLSHVTTWPKEITSPPVTGCHFVLLPADTAFSKSARPPLKLAPTLLIPANRGLKAPSSVVDGSPANPPLCYTRPLVLCNCGPAPPAPLSVAEAESLALLLCKTVLQGPVGLTLHWYPQTWPLDAILDDPQPTLDKYGFLPLDAPPLMRRLKSTEDQ